jgi:hypothetical protein
MHVALRRQMRSLRVVELTAALMLTAIVISAALQGDLPAGGFVAVDALCSIGLIGALAVTIQLNRRYREIRATLRMHAWRPVDGVWSDSQRGHAADILLRDPATGEQAVLRTPSVMRPDQDVRVRLWFAGDLRWGGVVTAAGGGHLSLVHWHRTPIMRRNAVPTPQWLDAHNWPRPAHALRRTYEIFDLDKLRDDGYVPPTAGDSIPAA